MSLSAIGRKALLEHGRQTKIAGRFRVSDQYVSDVVNGERIPKTKRGWARYARIQQAVADELNLTVEEAFSAYERGLPELASVA